MDIRISEQVAEAALVMTVIGELDVDSSPTLRATLESLAQRQVARVVVDLESLRFCDSMGLSAFLDAHRACARLGGYLRLAAPSPFLARTLAAVGLLDRVPVYRSVDTALRGDEKGLLRD
jgi:anti-sigma B factor antagonist